MEIISADSNTFEFNRHPLDPVTNEEYVLMQNDFESFIGEFLQKAEKEYSRTEKPKNFNWILFISLLGAGVFSWMLLAISINPHTADIFETLAFIFLFAAFIQRIHWRLYSIASGGKSTVFKNYRDEAAKYYNFHFEKTKSSANYDDYIRLISETGMEEFSDFYPVKPQSSPVHFR